MKSEQFWTPLVLALKKPHWCLSLLLWLAMLTPAQASLILRVAVSEAASQVKIGSSTRAIVRDANGQTLGEIPAMNGFAAQPKSGKVAMARWMAGQIWIEPMGNGYVWIGDRWYRGRTLLVPQKNGLTAINYVELEHYLYSVLGAEMNGNWPQEALKAQAVAARSYALNKRSESQTELYDLENTQLSQVYKGLETESSGTYNAVDTTAGQVLTYGGQIILAVFHSSSGGHTENVEDIWSQSLPYLRGVPDFDQGAPVYQWTKTFSRSELSAKISGVGNILSIKPHRTTAFGSIITMKVEGDRGSKIVSGAALREALGLKSTRFTVTPQYGNLATAENPGQPPTAFQVKGKGFGHGVGMSQWGAYNLAKQGYNYQQILLHYYQGAALAKIQLQ
ncbi:sporulation protein [Oscillatoriales cyanobacterium USR001]|nr:sporulation protein [Oscillatoriales cyanobacterium USR001]